MKIRKLLPIILIAVLICCLPAPAFALTANEVVFRAESKDNGDTSVEESTMILIDARGRQRVRKYMRFRKDFGPDKKDEKSISAFLHPADIKNTSYLTFEWDGDEKEDESWLYLPALKKVKRLASSDKSDAFLGSDFTYTDLKTSKRKFWDYTMVKESDPVDGKDCWLVEGLPKGGNKTKVLKETGYVKVRLWVQKDNFMKVKGKFWVKKGKRIKYYKASKIEKINGIWTAREMQMVTTKKKRKENTTILRIDKITYNSELRDNFFTVQTLESGI